MWCGSRGLGEDGDGDGEEDGEENGEEEGGPRARHGAVLQSHRGTLRRDRRREGGARLRALITAYTYPIDLLHFSSKMAVGAPRG